MTRTATLAAIRFGTGLAPRLPPPDGPTALLAGLSGPDRAVTDFPVQSFAGHLAGARQYAVLNAARRKATAGAEDALKLAVKARNHTIQADLRASLARTAFGPSGLRERLVLFWANFFTAVGRDPQFRGAVPAYIDDAIRPNLTGNFATLLRATTLHPVMLHYLNQNVSAGPNSPAARAGRQGLNENLAREVLELHALGSDGRYTQADVEALARLLTGASFNLDTGFMFRRLMAEPGPVTILGRSYGSATGRPELARIEAALDDLGHHPDTARHVARSLAAHFVADTPDPALVAHLETRFLQTGGALMPMYEALLEHPAAWQPALQKVRPPFDYVAAALRALDLDPAWLLGMKPAESVTLLANPLRFMGQPFQEPPSPKGWPAAAADWISPQGLAARIQWAMAAPRLLLAPPPGTQARAQNDPRLLVEAALADAADPGLVRAAAGAETRWDGVGIILASPAFNRR